MHLNTNHEETRGEGKSSVLAPSSPRPSAEQIDCIFTMDSHDAFTVHRKYAGIRAVDPSRFSNRLFSFIGVSIFFTGHYKKAVIVALRFLVPLLSPGDPPGEAKKEKESLGKTPLEPKRPLEDAQEASRASLGCFRGSPGPLFLKIW